MAGSNGLFRLSHRARGDLDAIWTYTAKTWSQAQAESYVAEILTTIESLARGERVGRKANLGGAYLKQPVGSHVVFYRIGDGRLLVVRVLHQRMDFERHL